MTNLCLLPILRNTCNSIRHARTHAHARHTVECTGRPAAEPRAAKRVTAPPLASGKWHEEHSPRAMAVSAGQGVRARVP